MPLGNDWNTNLRDDLIEKNKDASFLALSSNPCPRNSSSDGEDESIFENEDFKEFCVRLIEAMIQSSSSSIIETLVDAPCSGDTLIEDTVEFVESLEPYSENLEEF